ncbi:MAG: peptide-methionine (S)-S-oxide reductase MsrA [Gammaproteobacteria bacterium]
MFKRILLLSAVWSLVFINGIAAAGAPPRQTAIATFAGGCFWCMEQTFETLPGVIEVISGYTGGRIKNPTYQGVSSGSTGHVEAIQVSYDPEKISYAELLEVFWHNIDPTNGNGQFCDIGNQYRSVLFYHNDEQKRLADHTKASLEQHKPFSGPITTQIRPASEFYPAEQYHQNYYRKKPLSYKFYRVTCGRDQRLHELWGDD